MKSRLFIAAITLTLASCQPAPTNNEEEPPPAPTYETIGQLEQADPALAAIIDADAKAEIIAEGYDWSEGPLWLPGEEKLIWSDVPQNTIYQWTEAAGDTVYLTPSGYTSEVERGGETGSNGLTLDPQGRLVLCQHGNRQMARMDAPLSAPAANYTTLAGDYNGLRFNSPNDACYNADGDLFFTDPPYGLEGQMDDPSKETPYQGVYRVSPSGEVTLLVDSLTRPNGIAFLPGEQTLLVANSDPDRANWYAFDLAEEGSLTNARIFHAATGAGELPGLPDGLKVDANGNVYATGPGGVWFFDKTGKLLGKYTLPNPTSNCALSPDEKTLYVTNDMYILRLKLRL